MQPDQKVPCVTTIEHQKKITMTGVESVDSFSATSIVLTAGGKRVQIAGSRLKILTFSQGSGNFAASGEVASVRYGGAKGKTLQRLFK